LWTDKDLKEFGLPNDIYNSLEFPAFRKDMVMHYVLEKYGGVFMDFDFICLKPFDELAYRYSYFSGIEPPVEYSLLPVTSVALIGASKNNPIIT
jgi:mannosyltransferase OCH1-like enzyme